MGFEWQFGTQSRAGRARRIGKAAWRSSTTPQVPARARTESCVRACRQGVNTRMDRRARARLQRANRKVLVNALIVEVESCKESTTNQADSIVFYVSV